MLKLFLANLINKNLLKEAIKSLVYFCVFFILSLFPVFFIIRPFVKELLENYFNSTIFEITYFFIGLALNFFFSYIFLLLKRENYFYQIVKNVLQSENIGKSKIKSELVSIIRVMTLIIFSLLSSILGFFFPPLGFLLMSFCLALEAFSYSFDELEFDLKESFNFVFTNFFSIILLGMTCFSLTLVPFLGIIALPATIKTSAQFIKNKVN